MKNHELIKALSERTPSSQHAIKKVLGALSEIITEHLQEGEEVVLHRSLGTFKVETKAEKTVKNNLQGGEMTIVPAHKKPIFKISQALKDTVNL